MKINKMNYMIDCGDCSTIHVVNVQDQISFLWQKFHPDQNLTMKANNVSSQFFKRAEKVLGYMSFSMKLPPALKLLDNLAIGEEKKQEIINQTEIQVHEDYYSYVLRRNMTMLEEQNQFFNWYQGYTQISLPWWEESADRLRYTIFTSAVSGSIKTKYYGEKYDSYLIERKLAYLVAIFPPKRVLNNRLYRLTIEVEWVSMRVSENGKDNLTIVTFSGSKKNTKEMDPATKKLTINVRSPGQYHIISLSRNVNSKDIEITPYHGSVTVPGFLVKWKYNKILKPDAKYKKENSDFIR